MGSVVLVKSAAVQPQRVSRYSALQDLHAEDATGTTQRRGDVWRWNMLERPLMYLIEFIYR